MTLKNHNGLIYLPYYAHKRAKGDRETKKRINRQYFFLIICHLVLMGKFDINSQKRYAVNT